MRLPRSCLCSASRSHTYPRTVWSDRDHILQAPACFWSGHRMNPSQGSKFSRLHPYLGVWIGRLGRKCPLFTVCDGIVISQCGSMTMRWDASCKRTTSAEGGESAGQCLNWSPADRVCQFLGCKYSHGNQHLEAMVMSLKRAEQNCVQFWQAATNRAQEPVLSL